jgi:hypothetical protein
MKLFLVHVGFYDAEIGIYELHSNLLVAAEDARSAKEQVQQKPVFINKKMHIDAIQELTNVDGYDIILTKSLNQAENQVFNYSQIKEL